MDVCSVRSNSRKHDATTPGDLLCFTASLISYGYLGDVIKDSENFRWLGPRRYDYSG
jgi:ceramide kinase